jgi:hypothetical protein
VAAHDFRHSGAIRRTASHGLHDVEQAMNQLLRSLEGFGYVQRSDSREDRRTRVLRLTKRGRAAYSKIADILRDVEREWIAELGPKPFAELKALLTRVWESPLTWPDLPDRSD